MLYNNKQRNRKNLTIANLLPIGVVFLLLMCCQINRPSVWLYPIEKPEEDKKEVDLLAASPEPIFTITIDLTKPTLYETKEWICDECTYRNPKHSNICVMCNTVRINKSKQWQCEECQILNHLLLETCEACEADRPSDVDADLFDSSSEYYSSSSEDSDTEEGSAQEEEICPICLEEDCFEIQGTYDCAQCKNSICQPCYQDILKSTNRCCPMCRYENYLCQEVQTINL